MFIGIAGTIGAGKTAFVQELSDQLGYTPVFEPVEDNRFFEDFYADKARWGLHSQLTFLVHKILKQREIAELLKTTNCIQDRMIYEDFMFAKMLHDAGFMEEREHELYHKVKELCEADLFFPDLIIYLNVSVDTAIERITSRARGGETPDRAYMNALDTEYSALIHEFRNNNQQILELDWNEQRPLDRLLSRQTLFTIQDRLI